VRCRPPSGDSSHAVVRSQYGEDMAPRRPRIRQGVSILVPVVLVALLGITIKSVVWPSPPRWDAMEEALGTFPVPEGFELANRRQAGEHCVFAPCQAPRLSADLVPLAGHRDIDCVTLTAAVHTWETAGFVLRVGPRDHGGACAFDGQVAGFPSGTYFSDGGANVSVFEP
jgi:hypothetical protein